VQVAPIKPTLNAPGSRRLKLEFDELHSSFDTKINLGRYYVVAWPDQETRNLYPFPTDITPEENEVAAGAYTRPLFSST